MKKIALYISIIVLFICSIGFAQDSIPIKKNRMFLYGFNISVFESYYIGFNNVNISAVITSNTKYRHSIYFGPMIEEYDIFGMQGGYKFFPNPKQKRFNFHFFYDIKYINYSSQSHFQNVIGYGFHLNIISNLYLNNNIGAGISKNIWRNYNGPGIHERSNNFTSLISVGIGYNF